MKNLLSQIFKKKNNIIIGVIHFPPLLGYVDFPGFKVALRNAVKDLRELEEGGVDGIIVENNYDVPHKPKVDSEIVASMTYLTEKIKSLTSLPLGISTLWNDYETALSIAKILDCQFVRIPVFVDKIKTDCGVIEGKPQDVIKFRKIIKADRVAIFTDIHVKHSKILSKSSIIQSAKRAITYGSNGLILTGTWTGQAPDLKELKSIRKAVGNFPILIGSGGDKNNIADIFQYANAAIVSTSLKRGGIKVGEVNVKNWRQRIDQKLTSQLVKSAQ